MRFTYIVQLILVVNVTVSAMNVLPAEGLLFFFNPLYGDVGMAAADRHVDCLCRCAINGVVVTLFE